MKHQTIFSLAVAMALIPLTGHAPDVSPPPPVSGQPQATLPPVDDSKQLSRQVQGVLKLVSSGVPNDVVKAYINSAPSEFNLTPDAIIYLQHAGVTGALITDMLNHDASLHQMTGNLTPPGAIPGSQLPPAAYATEPAPQTQPTYAVSDTGTEAAPPPNTDAYNQLSPYGDWNNIPDYGWGWQPSSWGGWVAGHGLFLEPASGGTALVLAGAGSPTRLSSTMVSITGFTMASIISMEIPL
jgi:hypothetical protein